MLTKITRAKHSLPNTAKNSHNNPQANSILKALRFTALSNLWNPRSDPGCYNNLGDVLYTVHYRMTSSITSFFRKNIGQTIWRAKIPLICYCLRKNKQKFFFYRINPYQVIICPRLHRGPLSILVRYFCLFTLTSQTIQYTVHVSRNLWYTAHENDYDSGTKKKPCDSTVTLYSKIHLVVI